jgi:hypothetical protein
MTYEKDPFELEEIPDYAMQPAKEADEYNIHYVPRGTAGRFDPAAYEKVLYDSVRQAEEQEGRSEMLEEEPKFAEAQPVMMEAEPEAPEEQPEILEAELEIAEEEPEALKEYDMQKEIPASRPVFQPVFIPKTMPAKIVPMTGSTVSSRLKLVDLKRREPFRMTIEEDILVPDVKPDLARILSMDGKVKLADQEIHTGQAGADTIRLNGDLILQTLYVPEHITDGESIVAIESRIPFKSESEMKAAPYSELTVTPVIESLDHSIINERKFRAKLTVKFGFKEYSKVDAEVFEGVRNEDLQMLKEKLNLTDVAVRKKEPIEVKEDLVLKETMPEIIKILKYDVNVIENHKQITKEKAVINASVYCNVLYLGAGEDPEQASAAGSGADSESEAVPVFYQGKTEFTQFIRLDGESASNEQPPTGSRASFDVKDLSLTAKEDGSGKKCVLGLEMNVDTGLELYKTLEKEIVADVYHHKKDIQFETDQIAAAALSGSGTAEISAREIVNIPERFGTVDKVVYLTGTASEKRTLIDQGKCITEGVVTADLIFVTAEVPKTVFSIRQEIPFRSAVEIPGITPDMTADNEITLKELWSDKINNRQIEVNAGIQVNTTVADRKQYQPVKNISFVENSQDGSRPSGIVLYVTRPGDTIWKIAKKYRTTIEDMKKINEIETGKEVAPGMKLLIVGRND